MRTRTLATWALLLASCTMGVVPAEAGRRHRDRDQRVQALGIPEGHLPPPGECRIWFPGKPPGQQPPPGRCSTLRREIPPGAWLLHRPEDRVEEVAVNVYDARRPRVVLEVRLFDAGSGRFLRFETRR
jgi:hypothetical protein